VGPAASVFTTFCRRDSGDGVADRASDVQAATRRGSRFLKTPFRDGHPGDTDVPSPGDIDTPNPGTRD
jgi:hypothetical protein